MPNNIPWTITARWIVPVSQPPLPGGTVTILGERITDVQPHGDRVADIDLGDVAVLPGLVNAHTHLDLSGLSAPIPFDGDFTHWLRGVIGYRRNLSLDDVRRSVQTGIEKSISHGVTLMADIASQGLGWDLLAGAALRSVVFHELIGLPADRATTAWSTAEAWLHSHAATTNCRPGLSPHAPYSAAVDLITAAASARVPIATHLAETIAERELLSHHTGPFISFLEGLGAWAPNNLAKSFDDILSRSRPAPNALFAHGNYLSADASVPPNGTIVYCPRTHAFFGHSPHPFRAFLSRGVRLALGTDSLASNPDLDLLAEARFLHRQYPEIPGSVLLHMATLSGAEALGWDDETGSLTAGKSADLVVVPLRNVDSADVHQLVLDSSEPVQRVLWRGQWVYDGCGGGAL